LDFIVTLQGVATIDPADPSGTTLVIQSAQGPFRLAFSNAAAPEVQFPKEALDGQNVVAHVLDAAGLGVVAPGGEAIDYPGLRIATSAGYRFLLGESPVASPGGLPLVPRPLDQERDASGNVIYPPIEDYPLPEVFADHARFVPSSCGLLYYDLVRMVPLDEPNSVEQVLKSGQQIQMAASAAATGTPWTVHHVLSWHRNTSCKDRVRAWTQIALWR
jgi:hypothetical protein